jgi:hypothetical protein
MKLQLTKTAKQELKTLTVSLNKQYGDDWPHHKLKSRERLLLDAMLYIEEAYVNNSFKQLDNWCKRTGEGEFQNDYRMRVKKNIGKMLIEDIVTIVE